MRELTSKIFSRKMCAEVTLHFRAVAQRLYGKVTKEQERKFYERTNE
jgi:hypothetical protein